MAVVNICRAAWKGPRVTRRTRSFSFSLSLSPSSALLAILLPSHGSRDVTERISGITRVVSLSLSVCISFFLLFFFSCSRPEREPAVKQIIPARRSKTIRLLSSNAPAESPTTEEGSLGKCEMDRTTTLENSASHAMTLAALARLRSLAFSWPGNATASRSQDVVVSGVRQLSFVPSTDDEIDDVDEDASMLYILGFRLVLYGERKASGTRLRVEKSVDESN